VYIHAEIRSNGEEKREKPEMSDGSTEKAGSIEEPA